MAHVPFHRPARRFHGHTPPSDVKIAPPPALGNQKSPMAAAVQTVVPIVSVAGMGAFMFLVPGMSPVMMIVMGTMMGLMVVGTMLLKILESRQSAHMKRQEGVKYTAHLDQTADMLLAAEAKQRTTLNAQHPAAAGLFSRIVSREHLWERRPSDPDFLSTRIGLGNVPHAVRPALDLPPNPLADHRPELLSAARRVVERFDEIPDVPMTVELTRRSSVSIIAPPETARGIARSLIVNLVTAHAPDELAIAIYAPADDAGEWEWAKWLPHVRDPASRSSASPRCLMTSSALTLGQLLNSEARQRRQEKIAGEASSHLVVFIDGYAPRGDVAGLPIVASLLETGRDNGVTVVSLVDERGNEPERVDERIEYTGDGVAKIGEVHMAGEQTARPTAVDTVSVAAAERIARELAPVRLRDRSGGATSAGSGVVRLLDLLDLPSADAVNPATSWKARPLLDVLKVPIGSRGDGDPMIIDLKESAMGGMGPHGLVIGATGSGKSELLRTLVSGLAVTHPPDILSFVFVDFKGGAAFADLALLPHVAGMITNLQGDLSRVDRMYAALVGEQERRQSLFRAAGNVDGIKEYQAVYARRRDELEPVPYLMLVVDEFGELLAARPDFLDLFNAIGRVGRSLGMHLLLSSQRLDEGRLKGLEGHLRYRICLRTFSPQESSAVLGTPDAYHLPSIPGAGYLKVDSTLTRFQTALVSAPYLGHHAVRGGAQTGPIVLPFVGMRGAEVGDASGPIAPTGDDTPTEMEVAIDRLRDYTGPLARTAHQVWLPPLEPEISFRDIMAMASTAGIDTTAPRPFGPLCTPIGMIDLPAKQAKEPCILDLAGGGGHLRIGGAAQTGKSTLIRSLVMGLASTHSPEDVNVYCLDFGGGSLRSLGGLPHVGGVFGKPDAEKVRRLIREIQSTLETREAFFRKHNIDSVAIYRERRAAGTLPEGNHADIFLIVDNWAGFHADFEDIELELLPILATGLGYGIHIVMTANRWGDIRTNIRDNIGGKLEFRLNDPTDSEMARGASKTLPASIPGRGLLPNGVHFQCALPRFDDLSDGLDSTAASDAAIAEISARWHDAKPAAEIRLLPTHVELSDVTAMISTPLAGVPVGIEELQLGPVGVDILGQAPHFVVLGDGETGKTNFLRLVMHQLTRTHTPEEVQFVIVDYRRTLLDVAGSQHVRSYAPTDNLAKEFITQLRATLTERLPSADVTREQLMARSWWTGPEIVVVLDDYDLVVSPSGNPISPLLDLLPQARDVGVHILLARRVGGIARTSFEPIFQRLKELATPGLILSGDPMEGAILGTQRAQNLPPGRGFLVRRGQRTCQIQTAVAEPAD